MSQVERLSFHKTVIPQLSQWHFDQWGPLTGSDRLDDYARVLSESTKNHYLPMVLVAMVHGMLAGSITLLKCDMTIRSHLRPWLGQLFVAPHYRNQGIGSKLVHSAVSEVGALGYGKIYLYTSGTLPVFYERLGWSLLERVEYLGKERSVLFREIINERTDRGLPNQAL